MVRAEKARTERREAVLAAARRVFSAQGYHETNISDILEAAGIARGTFYLYFVSKRAIFDALLDEFFALVTREVRLVDVSPGAPPPRVQLENIVRHVLSTAMANADLTRILLREAYGLDDDFDHKLAAFYGRILKLLEHALGTGVELGLVREGDLGLKAHMALGSLKQLVDGLIARAESGVLVDLDLATREVIAYSLNGLFRNP